MCENCKSQVWPTINGPAMKCGHEATSVGFAYCKDCAERLGVCPGCGDPTPKKHKG